MLKKRIIPCLDIKNGRTVKGINFLGLRDAGDPVELARKYAEEGADEIVFLDITASQERRKTLLPLVKKIAASINIPFTVGGGIGSVEDASLLIEAGADKISVNSSAIKDPNLINQLAANFGTQCVVAAIDIKENEGTWEVFSMGGSVATGIKAIDWSKEVVERGAGEILLTSMNNDGTKGGFSIEITNQIASIVDVPVIASGGAGKKEHFVQIFEKGIVSAALAASIFHFNEIPIPELKDYLTKENINIR